MNKSLNKTETVIPFTFLCCWLKEQKRASNKMEQDRTQMLPYLGGINQVKQVKAKPDSGPRHQQVT